MSQITDVELRKDLRALLVDPQIPNQMGSLNVENNVTLIIDYIRGIAPELCDHDEEPMSDDDLADMSGATEGDR